MSPRFIVNSDNLLIYLLKVSCETLILRSINIQYKKYFFHAVTPRPDNYQYQFCCLNIFFVDCIHDFSPPIFVISNRIFRLWSYSLRTKAVVKEANTFHSKTIISEIDHGIAIVVFNDT